MLRVKWIKWLGLTVVFIGLAACSSAPTLAPVTAIGKPTLPQSGHYAVKAGDTLYSIAWAYAMDYRHLAELNNLTPPYPIHPGEVLRLRNRAVVMHHRPVTKTPRYSTAVNKPQTTFSQPVRAWLWPVKGQILAKFSTDYTGNPGIDIGGNVGEPVHAAAGGVVVYSGAGVRGYGNLIIIKHNNSYLSAYAFNEVNLVGNGAWVKAGQVIAKMGQNNAGKTLLHFEIRRNGLPVNPLRLLM